MLFLAGVGVCGLTAPDDGNDWVPGGMEGTIVLDSAKEGESAFLFRSQSYGTWENYDICVEPWCTENAGLCGNWIDVGEIELDEMKGFPPAAGYLSDKAGFEACEEVIKGHTYINKDKNNEYFAFKITEHEYTDDEQGCNHKITIEYIVYFTVIDNE